MQKAQLPNAVDPHDPNLDITDLATSYNMLLKFVRDQHLLDPVDPTIFDVTQDLPVHRTKRYARRSPGEIMYIVIHHVGHPSLSVTPASIARYHVNKHGWPGAGYHYYVRHDGRIYEMNDPSAVSYHCNGKDGDDVTNKNAVGVCLEGSFVGDKVPPPAQLDATRELNAYLMRTRIGGGEPSWAILGHRDIKGTTCPGSTWDAWRRYVIPRAT